MDFEARQAAIKEILTCPICNKLCRDVTIIEECCHIFCRKCITKKITEEKLRCCPLCRVDLGNAPLQKLKADYRWQSIRNTLTETRQELIERGLIKGKTQKFEDSAEEEEKGPAGAPPIKKKEKFLSSLVSTKDGSNQTAENAEGGRRRSSRRKTLLHPTLSLLDEEFSEEMEDEHLDIPKSPLIARKVASRTHQGSSSKSSRKQSSKKGKEHRAESIEEMNDLLKPLEDLSNGHGASSSSRFETLNIASKSAATALHGYENRAREPKGKEKVSDSHPMNQTEHQDQEKRRPLIEDLNIPAQVMVDCSSNWFRKEIPIWFQLVPSYQLNCGTPLPPLSSSYLKVKDANMPASFIEKYLVKKLGLLREDEVEISMLGWPIPPEMELHDLLDAWVSARPRSQKTAIKVGGLAEEFVMVLSYSRRPPA